MASTTEPDTGEHPSCQPKSTTNNLADIIKWLGAGDYVVVHNNYKHGRFFHKQCPDPNFDIDQHRVTYVNVGSMPGLLDDGEWEWYIKNSGCHECSCPLKTATQSSSGLKYVYQFSLGY